MTWAHTYQRSEMTTGEADAYRSGVADCVAILERMAADMRTLARGHDLVVWANSAALEQAAEVCRMLKPRAAETGLCGRGA